MKNRSVLTVILFSFLTLGIYTLFWLRDTRKELLRTGVKILPVKVLLFPAIALIGAALLQFVIHYATNMSNTGDISSTGGANTAGVILNLLTVIVGVLVVLVVLPLTIFWFYRYCQAVETITNKQSSLGVSFGLLLVLNFVGFSFVWPGIIQDAFNKLSVPDQTVVPPSSPLNFPA